MRQMVEDLAVAEDDESPPGDAAKQLQEPAVPRSVDTARADDRQLDARAFGGGLGEPLAFELGDLVDVTRPKRRVLVRRRVLDVAVDADGAAVDDATRAAGGGRVARSSRPIRRSRGGRWPRAGPPDDTARRRDRRRPRRVRRASRSSRRSRSPFTSSMPAAAEIAPRLPAYGPAHGPGPPRTCQRPRQVSAGESRRAGDEGLHRSASTVTGDPARRSRPTPRQHTLEPLCGGARSEALVQRDRQHELPVDASDAEPVGLEGRGGPRLGEHAIGFDVGRPRPRKPPRDGLDRRHRSQGGKVDDDPMAADAAQLADALAPVRRVHQHAQAHGDVERAIGMREVVRVSGLEADGGAARFGARARHAQHLVRRVDGRHVRAGPGEDQRRAAVPVPTSIASRPSSGPQNSVRMRACVSASSSPTGPPNRARSKESAIAGSA